MIDALFGEFGFVQRTVAQIPWLSNSILPDNLNEPEKTNIGIEDLILETICIDLGGMTA